MFGCVFKFCLDKKKALYDRKFHKRLAVASSESEYRFQVTEFNGELYISYQGVPLIKQSLLTSDIIPALNEVRKDFVKWNMANVK